MIDLPWSTAKAVATQWMMALELESMRYFGAAVAVTLLLWVAGSWGRSRRIQQRRAAGADRWREVRHSIRTLAIFGITGVVIFTLLQLGAIRRLHAPASWMRLTLEFLVIVLAHDTYFYWMHRGLHTRALFRLTHATHHRSRIPTPWAAYCFAPLEAVTESMFLPLFLMIVPMHRAAIMAFLIHQIARNAIGHCGHELFWPGFTRARATRWCTTTTHHDLHHSAGRCNFGLYFTWWDRLMGTEHPDYHRRFEAAARGQGAGAGHAAPAG